MENFEYKVSVIVPVYNCDQYIDSCMNSLLNQTLPINEFEIIFINDGSTDKSKEKCEQYEKIYNNVVVINKENGGVSSARNIGIKIAKGKYLLYLDSDDEITANTLEKVSSYFDSAYDKIDICTYKIVSIKNGVRQPLHFRYKYMNKTGYFDVNEYPYISQSPMNIMVKNGLNIYFDTNLTMGEDQKYISTIISRTGKIGYCNEAEYHYIKRDDGAVATRAYSYYMFEQRMALFKYFLDLAKAGNNLYMQSQILANWSWEITSDCILPYHYGKEKYAEAVETIKDIVSEIDDELILNHPQLDMFHKHYLLALKNNYNRTLIVSNNNTQILANNRKLYSRNGMEIVINKVTIEDGTFQLLGFIKSPIFNYFPKIPKLFAIINNEMRYDIKLFDSIHGCYKSKMKTNNFWGFWLEKDIENLNEIELFVEIDGKVLNTFFYMMPSSNFNVGKNLIKIVRDDVEISLTKNKFCFDRFNVDEVKNKELNRNNNYSREVLTLRKEAIEYRSQKRTWIYVDSYSVKKDNAYYQFQADFYRKDGIERWYVIDGTEQYIDELFDEEQKKYIIKYGSRLHKMLYIAAEYILCSFSDYRPMIPFKNEEEQVMYRDIAKAKKIYLQHGVCHADLRYTQSAERYKVDKIVVSSQFEKDNFVNNYHYREQDIIPCGMPRYDHIDRTKKPLNRILFAPSWRSYLMGRNNPGKREISESRLYNSEYFEKYMKFLTSEELNELLEKNDLYLDAKLHQNMRDALQYFEFTMPRINLITDDVDVADYKLFITDISSYVFDYAYLDRAILYFMPDKEKFDSGMNHYRKLHIPLEKGFGPVTYEVEEVIDEIKKFIKNDFSFDDIYRNRMESFYLPMENCEESLYNYLK